MTMVRYVKGKYNEKKLKMKNNPLIIKVQKKEIANGCE